MAIIITPAEMVEHYKPLGELYLAYKRIEELEADNARLREALRDLLDLDQRCGWHSKQADAAIAALQETSHDQF